MLPDLGNCPQIKGIFVVFRDQDCLGIFFFNSEHAQMGHVWSGHVHIYNLVHFPGSDMCKKAWQLIFKQCY